MAIVSNKINQKYFNDAATVNLKLRFYTLMIQYGIHKEQYLDVSQYHHCLFTTDIIRNDDSKWPEIVVKMIIFCVLAKHDNAQSDMLNRLTTLEEIDKLPQCLEFARLFTSKKLISFDNMIKLFSGLIVGASVSDGSHSVGVFDQSTQSGKIHQLALKERVTEHNIRVVSRYYSRIRLLRLAELIGLDVQETEDKLCGLVVDGSVYAKIDRPRQLVNFIQPRTVNQSLDSWVSDVNGVLTLVEKTCHLIEKENILYKIVHTK